LGCNKSGCGDGVVMARPGYLPLGERLSDQISMAFHLMARSNAYRFSQGLLKRVGVTGRGLVAAVPYFWLLLFFVVPFIIVLKISVAETQLALPPYTSLWQWTAEKTVALRVYFGNYAYLFNDHLYLNAFLNSVKVALISTFFCLLIGYPMAYGIARSKSSTRNILLMLVILPFWTSFLLRVYAWIGLLKNNGVINQILQALGIVDEPIVMLYTQFAMYIGIVYSYLPFMILPLYANLEKMDWQLLEAAEDLGCKPWQAFYKITLPLSRNGILAGSMLVFIPAVGEFVIPALLGGPNALMIGRVLWDEFFSNRDWPVASSVAIALLLLLVPMMMWYQSVQAKESAGK
jgi:putrescine transport system permease protein